MTIADSSVAQLTRLADAAEALLAEQRQAQTSPAIDWTATAFRWRGDGRLEAIHKPHTRSLDLLPGIDTHTQRLVANRRRCVSGGPANNALLWRSRGTGKSSLIRALPGAYAADGLRIIEVGAE